MLRRTLLAGFTSHLFAAGEPRVKVGCQANAWPLDEGNFAQLLGALLEMHEIGYRGFGCNVRFVRGQFGNAKQARKAMADTGVSFIGAHMSLNQAGEWDARAEGVAALGGERMVVSAKGLAPDGRFTDAALRQKADRLATVAEIAKRAGIRVAYHNHNDEFANSNAEMEALAKALGPDTMDFLVDAGHGYLGGGDPAKFLTRHPHRVFGCHLKTYKGKQQVPLGQGDFGFERLAEAVKETRWSGWLITEEGGGTKLGNTAAVRPDREYIRRIFGQ